MGVRGVSANRSVESEHFETDGIAETAGAGRGPALDHYTTYLPSMRADAQVSRHGDGFVVRGEDEKGAPFELDSRRDGRDLTLTRNGSSTRFTLHGSSANVFVDDKHLGALEQHTLKGPLHRDLALSRQIYKEAGTQRPSPEAEDQARAARFVTEARAHDRAAKIAQTPVSGTQARQETVLFGDLARARSGATTFLETQGERLQEHEVMYRYAHANYGKLRGRLASSATARYAKQEPVPQLFVARNNLRNEAKRQQANLDRAHSRLLDFASSPEFTRRSTPDQLAFLERVAKETFGTAASAKLHGLLEAAKSGAGPLAHLMRESSAHEREQGILSTDVAGRAGEVPGAYHEAKIWERGRATHVKVSAQEAKMPTLARIGNVVSVAASSAKLAMLIDKIRAHGASAADLSAIAQTLAGGAAVTASLLGQHAIDRGATSFNGAFGVLTAVLELKHDGLNKSLAHTIGTALNAVGSALLLVPNPVAKLCGIVIDGIGAGVKLVASFFDEHPTEALMRKHRLLAERD